MERFLRKRARPRLRHRRRRMRGNIGPAKSLHRNRMAQVYETLQEQGTGDSGSDPASYRECSPFMGAVLAGDFTDGALDQLRSHGFNLAYSPYEAIVRTFGRAGADVSSDERTTEDELWRKVRAFNGLRVARRRIREEIRTFCADQFDPFFNALRRCLDRRVRSVFVLTLSGASRAFDSIEEAVLFVSEYDESISVSGFVRYELNVRYSNEDEVRGSFRRKERCIDFLRSFER